MRIIPILEDSLQKCKESLAGKQVTRGCQKGVCSLIPKVKVPSLNNKPIGGIV